MEIIRAIELKNKGAFVARLRVKNSSGAVITSQDILLGKSTTIDLNQCLDKFNDGDIITVGVAVVAGRSKKSSRQFIYRAGALEKANFEISGTTLSSKLTFVETKTAYDYHFMYDDSNPHKINGISYLLAPEDSIAIVYEQSGGYKGAVKIPSTITYKRKKYVVTEIGNQAFGYCDELTSLTLPASICCICDFVFIGDGQLKNLRVETDTPPFVDSHGFQEFTGIDSCTLSVPLGSVESYRNEYYWGFFKNIKAYWNRRILEKIQEMLDRKKVQDIHRKNRKRSQE